MYLRQSPICTSIVRKLVITKVYGVRATTIESQNAFALSLWFAKVSLVTDTRVIILRVIGGPNARNQIAFCAFHSFLVEVQMNAGYIQATHA